MADNDRPRRDDAGSRDNDRPNRPAPRRDERPARSDRPAYGDREERPARRDDRPSYGNRDERPARRDDRPSYGNRDERPARRDDRSSYGTRDERPARSERPPYGNRDDRPSYGNRDERPARSERPSYGNRDERPARRDDRSSYGTRDERPARSERPSYGGRDERPSYGNRDGGGRGGERQGRDGRAGGHATRGGQRFEDDRGVEQRGGTRLVPNRAKLPEPRIDEDVTGFEIDRSVKNQLLTLSKENAQGVGQHLVMTARLLDAEDFEGALAHAETAVRRGGRVPAVREALGLVHYSSGDFAKALTEFRTARRLSGSNHLIPYLVDCERALGRPEKALELAHSNEAQNLPAADKVELLIIESGIRRDLGQLEASKLGLEVAALDNGTRQPWYPRLAYAYAEALLALDDTAGAREWFAKAEAADHDGMTDADERVAELDGYSLVDLLDGDDDESPSAQDTDPLGGFEGARADRTQEQGATDGRDDETDVR